MVKYGRHISKRRVCLPQIAVGQSLEIKEEQTVRKIIGILLTILTLVLAGGAFQSWV